MRLGRGGSFPPGGQEDIQKNFSSPHNLFVCYKRCVVYFFKLVIYARRTKFKRYKVGSCENLYLRASFLLLVAMYLCRILRIYRFAFITQAVTSYTHAFCSKHCILRLVSPPGLLVLLGNSGAFEDLACWSLSALSLSRPAPVRESCSCIFGV